MDLYTTIAIALLYIASIAIVPWMLIQLPTDYFAHEERETCLWKGDSALIKSFLVIFKNIVGAILLIAGIAMLFLPGQGLLTIIGGLFLMNFPYKYQVEKWVINKPIVLKTFNLIRRKAKKEPFTL